MSSCLNKVCLLGYLGGDPDVRFTQAGQKMANLRLATTETWLDKKTEQKHERTEWHSIVIFNAGLCSILEQLAKKGTRIYLEGSLQTRKWSDQAGNDRYTTEIVLGQYGATLIVLNAQPATTKEAAPVDDEIPF